MQTAARGQRSRSIVSRNAGLRRSRNERTPSARSAEADKPRCIVARQRQRRLLRRASCAAMIARLAYCIARAGAAARRCAKCRALLRKARPAAPRARSGPNASAVAASIGSPSRISCRARTGPICRVTRTVPPAAGIAPSLISGSPNRARSPRDDEIAADGEFEAAAERHALDHGERRLRAMRQPVEQHGVASGIAPACARPIRDLP